jgi:antitoxin component YwqK of YwqJK toxin-antitoxin module
MRFTVLFLLIIIAFSPDLLAQGKKKDNRFEEGKTPTIVLDSVASDKKEETPKKIPKKVFYGLKTKKGYAKSFAGGKQVVELFYTLKEYQEPNAYIRDIYWFHPKQRKIMKGLIPDKDKGIARILHGPYKKLIEGNVVEEGIYYVGTKHGRWERYDEKFTLLSKEKYYKGWPKESEITYYDVERKRIKEVKPYMGDVVEGNYYSFHENGQLAVEGKYEKGKKVGVWIEYYDFRRRRHKEFQYPETADAEPFEPYLLREYDRSTRLIYDKVEEDKKKARAQSGL